LACGVAPGVGLLIAARIVQGAGAAAMIPQIISVIQQRFEGPARARALGAYAAVLATGAVAGLVAGGLLVTANLFGWSWRPVFLVDGPIGRGTRAIARGVRPRDEPRTTGRGLADLDLAGLATAGPAVFLVVTPLMLGHQEHWPAWTIASMAAGVALAVAFVAV